MLTNINKIKQICLFALIGLIVIGFTCVSLIPKASDKESKPLPQSSTTTTSTTTTTTTTAKNPDTPDDPKPIEPKNIKICIDAGHGWNDPGVVWPLPNDNGGDIENGDTPAISYYEKDINIEIAKHMRDALVSMGYEVVMMRESDDTISPSGIASDGICNITRRVEWLNTQNDIDLVVSIHCDSVPSSTATYGTRIYYLAERIDNLAEKFGNHDLDALGNELKSFLFNEGVLPKSPSLDNESKRLLTLTAAKMPAILIECGFMTSPYDLRVLTDADYQKLYGTCLANAVNSYFDIINRQAT